MTIDPGPSDTLPPVETAGVELLEALFLEDSAPIAVFGARSPEAIALRIMTALWPSMRKRFAISTYCNSPRTISKQSFDLVFAPVDARPRFSDWKGRRVDGTRTNEPRHRWSSRIVDKVFRSPQPSLMALDVFGEMADDEHGNEDALRLSLLWEELSWKVDAEPHAALGLLDIANTRPKRREALVESLSTVLATAARNAVLAMPPAQSWRFLQVLIVKLGQTNWPLSLSHALRSSIVSLARLQPTEAIMTLTTPLMEQVGSFLMSGIAEGLAEAKPFEMVGKGLLTLSEPCLLKLILADRHLAALALGEDFGIEPKLLSAIKKAGPSENFNARCRLLELLVANRHSDLLSLFLSGSSGETVITQAKRLGETNRFEQAALNVVVVKAARNAGVMLDVRKIVAATKRSPAADKMLRDLLDATSADVDWILDELDCIDGRKQVLVRDVLGNASDNQLRLIIDRPRVLEKIVDVLDVNAGHAELLARIAKTVPLEPTILLQLTMQILPKASGRQKSSLAAHTVENIIRFDFGPERDMRVAKLLDSVEGKFDAARAIALAAAPDVGMALASRNLVLFDRSSLATRGTFLKVPEKLADAIIRRQTFDLSYEASEAVGRLLWDSSPIDNRDFLCAAAKLLPFAMNNRGAHASPIIAATFPSVYRALQHESLPDFLSFVFQFLDWDRCKVARKELAEAFLKSKWRPRDIALAAARAGDTERILRRIAKDDSGRAAIAVVAKEIGTIPPPWRHQISQAIEKISKDESR
ncbi:hypothetical protein [Novacetimonas sp. GS1]|uniref:hypothetical protein n=1 Tax=Novacetimonas sp. GS1 TaxID=3119990 RepID=UPI002FCD2E90